ncbi:helix-turn-helix domain-containing protein [Haloarchaeobius baliensis]|uniref:helix-turn-helix domain-containing protein n=1 Tax=Haloarchaeobius baliensis TaxID=1670458 RepID=UPI003F884065
MVYARFRVRFPESLWIGRLSREYPSAVVTALSAMGIDDSVVTLVEVVDAPPAEVLELARSDPTVTTFDPVAQSDGRLLFSYRTRSTLYRAAERSGVPPLYPVEVRDGWADIESHASREGVSKLVAELEAENATVEVTAISEGPAGDALLTERQREVLTEAYERGYYDSPRRCSTAELAEELGVAPSTISDLLRRAERRALGALVSDGAS